MIMNNYRGPKNNKETSRAIPLVLRSFLPQATLKSTMLRVLWWSAVVSAIATTYAHRCNNYLCDRVDQVLKNSLDRNINPCNNFQTYTCGSGRNSPPTSGSTVEGSITARNSDANIFRSILENSVANNNVNENMRSLKIEREIFNRCTQYGIRKNLDKDQYYKDLPQNAKNLELGYIRVDTGEHWSISDMDYAYVGYGFAFFDFKIVERGDGKYKKRYIQISPPNDNILDINSLLVKKYEPSGGRDSSRKTLLANLKDFLQQFSRIIPKKRQQDVATNIVEPQLLIKQWQNKWNEKVRGHHTAMIDWKKTVLSIFTSGIEAPNNDIHIIVNDESYFFDLIKLLSSTSMQTIENYVNLRYLSKTIGFVDENYSEYSFVPSISNLTCTPGLFVSTAHAYAVEYFPKANRDKLKEIFEGVRINISIHMMKMIGYNLDSASKSFKSFLWKLDNADVLYAYPSWLLDEKLVANFYPDNMVVDDRYFNNEEAVYKSVLRHNVRAYRDYNLPIIDIDQLFKLFQSDKIEVFEGHRNEIVIPIRAVSEANLPFFSTLLYDSMNYGSVATVLASEIYLKMLDTVDEARHITDCMNNQVPWNISKLEANDYKLKATAYLMGLRTAYEVWSTYSTYDRSMVEFHESGVIPKAQLFFLSFAETVCQNKKDESNDLDIEIEPFQCINTVVSNMKEFQKAFRCNPYSAMNKIDKCLF